MSAALKSLLLSTRFAPVFRRNLHKTQKFNTGYEFDGKTTVTVLNKNFDYGLMIDEVTEYGFTLNNNIRILGPMVIFPKTMMSWNIATSADMREDSFSLLLYMDPKMDIVVLGLDDDYPYMAPFLQNVRDIFKKHEIPLEILPVHQACSTFNFLNSEHRYAAAALVPPKIKYVEDLLLGDRSEKPKAVARDISEIPLLNPDEKAKSESLPKTLEMKLDEIYEGYESAKKVKFNRSPHEMDPDFRHNIDDTLPSQDEMKESFRVRSPWRPETKPESKSTSDYTIVGKKKSDKKS